MRLKLSLFPLVVTLSFTYNAFLQIRHLHPNAQVPTLIATGFAVYAAAQLLGCKFGRTARYMLYLLIAIANGTMLAEALHSIVGESKSIDVVALLNVFILALTTTYFLVDHALSKALHCSAVWPEHLQCYRTSRLTIPDAQSDPDVPTVVQSILQAFPIPSSSAKSQFKVSSYEPPGTFDTSSLRKLYQQLPTVAPSDYLFYGGPHYLSVELYVSYASTFLVDRNRSSLGLDPRQCGLWVDTKIPCRAVRFLLGEWAFGDVWSIAVNKRLSRLDELFDICSPEQRAALFEYLLLFSKCNERVFDDWIDFLSVRYKTHSVTARLGSDVDQ